MAAVAESQTALAVETMIGLGGATKEERAVEAKALEKVSGACSRTTGGNTAVSLFEARNGWQV